MNNLSSTAVQSMTAQETTAVFLHLLTIKIGGETILRAVDDKQELRSCGQTFIPCAFVIILPDQTSDSASKSCRLKIDNTDLALMRSIKKAASGCEISITVAVVVAHTPDTYERGPLEFILRNVTATKNDITGELFDFYLYDRKITSLTYSPQDFPGLFY